MCSLLFIWFIWPFDSYDHHFGLKLTSGADMKKRATNSSFPAFLAAKWLRTFGRTLALGIAWNKCKALCQWSAFSHALIAVLKVTTFGVIATWAVTNSQGVWSYQATVQEQCSKDFIGKDQCSVPFRAFDWAECLCHFVHLRFYRFGHPTLVVVHNYQPLSTIINHYQPLSTIINHYQPLSTILNHSQPLSTIINHYHYHW